MTELTIDRLLVVGAGVMGAQIAALGALGGLNVSLCDISKDALDRAQTELEKRLTRMAQKEKISQKECEDSLGRLRYSTDMASEATQADFVIEAVAESFPIKETVFRQLDQWLPEHAVIASNSSSIVASKLAAVTQRPDRVLNMHFFNPPLLMDCVEVVGHEGVSESAVSAAMALAETMNRQAVHVKKEIPGFIANRLLAVLFHEAIALYEGGYATAQEIDLICRNALNHPMGPFQLLDLGGIDVNFGMQNLLYEQTGDEDFLPQKTITEMVDQNLLGRKTGKGFYEYA